MKNLSLQIQTGKHHIAIKEEKHLRNSKKERTMKKPILQEAHPKLRKRKRSKRNVIVAQARVAAARRQHQVSLKSIQRARQSKSINNLVKKQ